MSTSTPFNAHAEYLGNLFNANSQVRNIIPRFQRGYMWQKKHVEALWDDLTKLTSKRRIHANHLHFFGPIVTLLKDDDQVLQILDGQQRLATATILLSVMRDMAKEIAETGLLAASEEVGRIQPLIEKELGGYSLTLSRLDGEFFRDYIQRKDRVASGKPKLRTNRNIVAAQRILKERLKAHLDTVAPTDKALAVGEIRDLRLSLLNGFVMTRIPVVSYESAFNIFETLNDRGLRLSGPDLLRNYLMGSAPEADQESISNIWDDILQTLEKHDVSIFLRHMWISRFGDLKEDDLFTALKKYIEEKKITSIDFASLCATECDDYVALLEADKDILGEATEHVRSLVRELSVRPALPLLLVGLRYFEKSDFLSMARLLLVFVTRYSILEDGNPAKMESLLFDIAAQTRAEFVANDEKPSSRAVVTRMRETLKEDTSSDAILKLRIPTLELEPQTARYFVGRIARYIQDPSRETTLGETNVEHIYPQNPSEDKWGGKENHKLMEPYTWYLGNLTIFGKRKNRRAGNQEFGEKRTRYAKSNVKMTNTIPQKYVGEWTSEEITDRATKMTDMILTIWNFNNGSGA